jgi:hypothetical protein
MRERERRKKKKKGENAYIKVTVLDIVTEHCRFLQILEQ